MKGRDQPKSIRRLQRLLSWLENGNRPPRHPAPFAKRDRQRRKARKFKETIRHAYS